MPEQHPLLPMHLRLDKDESEAKVCLHVKYVMLKLSVQEARVSARMLLECADEVEHEYWRRQEVLKALDNPAPDTKPDKEPE